MYNSIYLSQPTKTGSSSLLLATKEYGVKKNHAILTDKVVEELKNNKKKLSVVTIRNPYDRALSMYNFFSEFKDKSFDFFLETIKRKRNHQYYCPQYLYYQYGAFRLDEVIKLETIGVDWNRVIKNKMKIDKEVIHVNKDPRKEKQKLNSLEKEFIYSLYKEDFKIFGYTK